MTAQEYNEADRRLEMRMRQVEKQRAELKAQYIQSLPIKEGDKFARNGKVLGWYVDADTAYYRDRLIIMYNPPKKDGTRSRAIRHEYGVGIEEIEIVNQQ